MFLFHDFWKVEISSSLVTGGDESVRQRRVCSGPGGMGGGSGRLAVKSEQGTVGPGGGGGG